MAKSFLARARSLALATALCVAAPVAATDMYPGPLFPGADYDGEVPTLEQVVGHKIGEKITLPENAIRYMEALAAAYPDRVKLYDYAESWEGRRLIYVAISSPENIAKLDEFKSEMQAISDPRETNQSEADAIIDDLPASVWLSYGVHGNEISSTDAALATAYHLLASNGDERVARIMDNTVTFLVPSQNPDGRARFIHRYRTALGMEPDSDGMSVEQNEPWPSGRTNHYLFDMNRDWISLGQPEIRGQVAALREWRPIVFVDLHEMGGNSTYYFAPEADPYNPHLVPHQRANLFLFGQNNAKWFDQVGMPYFTRDVFDAFYPGYGASWPAYYGAIAMTYEQGSSRGLIFRKLTGEEFTYKDTVKGHFTTSMGTLEAASNNREKLLNDYYSYQATAVEEGQSERGKRYYVFSSGQTDKAGVNKLAGNLSAMGAEVFRTTDSVRACGATLPSGSIIIDSAQPAKRLLRTMLEPQVDLDADWMREQERRRRKDISHDIYDVTAWSLPKMYNLEMSQCDRADTSNTVAVAPYEQPAGRVTGDDDAVIYLLPWGDMAAGRLMTAALRDGLKMKTHNTGFTNKGRAFPRGTVIFEAAKNPEDLRARLEALAMETGAEVVASNSTWVDAGHDLGGRYVQPVHKIKIAMLWDTPTSQYSAGNSRYVIEQQMGYPVTIVRAGDLDGASLNRYDVLILPDSRRGYGRFLGASITADLKTWVRQGGVLIGQGGAVGYLASESAGFLSAKSEDQSRDDDADSDGNTNIASAEEYQVRVRPESERPDSVPGALAYGDIDTDHVLTAGVADTLNILVGGSAIYSPLTRDVGHNVVTFKGSEELLSSGYLWEENRKQLAYKPFVVSQNMGRGMVIGFTQDPTVRAYLDGLNVLYMNAIFRAAGATYKVR